MEAVQPPSTPIIVRVLDPPVRGLGLGDVILNAVGLTGALTVAALLLGLVLAGVVITYRRVRSRRITEEEASQTQSLGLTPPAHQ
jgi:ABC-type Fe3+ transport system permease subunit